MIFIDLSNFIPSAEWLAKAVAIKTELAGKATITEKNQYIDDNRALWSTLKETLPYADKCWFSEAKESVSVYEIEHFRPTKATIRSSAVLKVLKTFIEEQRVDWTAATKYRGLGYWWLAFDYANFRNCGKRVNMIKSARFPIRLGSTIAYSIVDNHNVEQPILLDPIQRGDPDLMTFDPDGQARPTNVNDTEYDYLRAITSIEIYGLNAIEPLVSHRQTKWKECNKAIHRAKVKYYDAEIAGVEGDYTNYTKFFNEFMDFVENDIKPAIDPASEFSAVAKACVLSYIAFDWINEYILGG